MIRSQKKIWPRLEVGVVTEIWVNMLGSSQNPTIFLLMIPTPKSIVHGKFIARDEQSRRKNHPPFSEVLTSWPHGAPDFSHHMVTLKRHEKK